MQNSLKALLFTLLILSVNGCTNCATCDASGCTSSCCSNCYQLISGGIKYCQLCQNGCSTCTGAGSQLCTSCDPYYYLINISGGGAYCQQCGANCLCQTTWNNCVGCADGYFLSGSSCSPCSGCTKCSGTATNCTDCNTNQYMNSGVCTNCPSSCSTCTSSISCQTCTDVVNMSGSICDCNSGYYLSGSSCQQCQLPCATCTSMTICQSCSGLNISYISNQCECDPNYVLISGVCTQCSQPCATCQTTQTYCITCISGMSIYSPGVCNCGSGKYYDYLFTCYTCTSPCSECVGLATYCTACAYSNMTPDAGHYCVCDSGYYLNVNQCSHCIAPCTNCSTSLICSQCQAAGNWVLNASTQSCICQPGYYLDSSNCNNCAAPCATCDTSATSCLSCIDPISQDLLQSTPCDCRIGYVFATVSSCTQCVLPCTNCSGTVNYCTQCIDPNHTLSSGQCVCQSGYGSNGTGCSLCQPPCLTCSSTVLTCLSCVDTSIFRLENNLCLCQNGYFAQGDQCMQCAPQCKTCLNYQDYCLTCNDLNHILTASNECVCDIGYLQLAGICIQCQSPCFSCSINPNNCLECVDLNANLTNSQCICKDGYYMDSDQICQLCNVQCLTCSSQNSCLTCPIQQYLTISSNCNQCQNPCKECTSQFSCVNCVEGYLLNIDQCLGCQEGCQYCNTLTNCQQCYDGYYLDSQNICTKCQDPCLTCMDNANKCLTCQSSKPLLINNLCVCQKGYYQNNSQCQECLQPCSDCTSQDFCTECQQLSQIQLIDNKCICQNGYFYNNSQCQICDINCLTCQEQGNHCLSCDPRNNRVLDQQTNQCICQSQYFSEDNELVCQLCTSINGIQYQQCQYSNCADGFWTYGEACDDGNNISRDGCTNCQIDQGYSCSNIVMEPSLCFKCLDNCFLCDLSSNCIQCQSGFYLQDQTCKICDDKCKTCTSNLICQECKYIKLNNQCAYCDEKVGYSLNQEQDSCITICGDNLLADTEECDDGNVLSNDGCNNYCQLESDYSISDGQIIRGSYPIPYLKETYQSYFDNKRVFQLFYLQLIQDYNYENYQQQMVISIKDYSIYKDFDLKLKDQSFIQNQNLWNVSITITIYLNITTIQKILSIQYLNVSINRNKQNLKQKLLLITQDISDYQLIDQSTIHNTQQAFNANSYMLYIILALILLSVLFGGIEIFYNLLDLLQLVSYLQYINTQFPYNLDTFIQLFQFAQFKLLDDYILLQSFYSGYLDNNIEPPAKINNDGYQTNILYNVSSLFVVWITFIGTYMLAHCIPYVLQKIDLRFNNEQDKQLIIWIKSILLMVKLYLQKFCFIIRRSFVFSGFFRTYISTTYDFCFFLMLNIYALQFADDTSNKIGSFLTLYLIIVYLLVLLLAFNAIYPQPNQLIFDKNKFGALYEGVKLDLLSKYYYIFLIIKKFFFMASLVLSYNEPLFQIFNIVMLSVMQLIYLFMIPLQELYEQRKQFLCEMYMSILELIILLFVIDDQQNLFVYDTRNQLGWICIGCITFMLITQIILDVHQQWSILIRIYQKIKKYIQQRFIQTQEEQYATNPNNLFQF